MERLTNKCCGEMQLAQYGLCSAETREKLTGSNLYATLWRVVEKVSFVLKD
jgi:hypothetical protein